jgi:hypothetical protein
MPTMFGVAAAVSVTAARLRARGARPVAGAGTSRTGTSPGIPAGRSWGRPTPAGRRARHPRPARHPPVARIPAPGPRPPGGAEVVLGARGDRVDRVARGDRVDRVVRLARPGSAAGGPHRPAALHGRRARRARGNRNAGDRTRAPGRRRAQVGRRRRVSAGAGASPARATPGGSTTSAPATPAGSWAMLRVAAARSRRRVLSLLPDDRCGTPTSGRPTAAAEPEIAAGVRCSPWVTPSTSRR